MSIAPKGAETADRFQRRREKTAADLLEAARRVIAQQGYHQTKITDIAGAARVGVGTFYLYYPTKQAIFLELVQDTVRQLEDRLDRVRSQHTDPATRSRESTATFFHFAQQNRELFRILFGHEAGFHDVVRHAQSLFVRDTVSNLQEGITAGIFRAIDPEITARALIGMATAVVTWWIEHPHVPVDEVTGSLNDLVFLGLCGREP